MSRKAIPLDQTTYDRVRAYVNRNLLRDRTHDDGINELLDAVVFPTIEEINEDYSVIRNTVPRFCDGTAQSTASVDSTGPVIRTRKSIPVTEATRDRLLAYCERHLPRGLCYDEAVNELLDWMGFPPVEEVYEHCVVWDVIPVTRAELAATEEFTPAVRTRAAVARGD
jgi:hypothetical protein